MDKAVPVLTNEITKKVSKEGAKGQYTSQEMSNLRRFLARFLPGDNQMTIILEIILSVS